MVLAGRYRLERGVGVGPDSAVWAATHLPSGRPVAVRRLDPIPELPRPEVLHLLAEVRSVCALDHPNVARCHEVLGAGAGEEQEAPAIVSELAGGETLAHKLSRAPMLGLEETASILLPVVSAIGTAHARGIVHGRLSSARLFVPISGAAPTPVKVVDFGLEKWAAAVRAVPPSVRAGSPVGRRLSPYAPPEQQLAARSVDHRADIWSLGLIVYECLSGLRAAELLPSGAGLPEAPAAIAAIEERVASLPRALADIIGHLLVSDPEHRAQNLIELHHALREVAGVDSPGFGWPGSERRITGLTQRPLPVAPRPPEPPAPEAPAQTPASAYANRWRSVALAAMAVAAAELVALVWLTGRGARPSGPDQADAPRAEARALEASPPRAPASVADFESGDEPSPLAGFGPWVAFSLHPPGRALELTHGPGDRSEGALGVPFLLEHALAVGQALPAAGVRARALSGVIDLSGSRRLELAYRLTPLPAPGRECTGPAELVVFVTCRPAAGRPPVELVHRLPASPEWARAVLPLEELAEQRAAPAAAGPQQCLQAAESIGVRAGVAARVDGGCDSGTLWLDDLGLR